MTSVSAPLSGHGSQRTGVLGAGRATSPARFQILPPSWEATCRLPIARLGLYLTIRLAVKIPGIGDRSNWSFECVISKVQIFRNHGPSSELEFLLNTRKFTRTIVSTIDLTKYRRLYFRRTPAALRSRLDEGDPGSIDLNHS